MASFMDGNSWIEGHSWHWVVTLTVLAVHFRIPLTCRWYRVTPAHNLPWMTCQHFLPRPPTFALLWCLMSSWSTGHTWRRQKVRAAHKWPDARPRCDSAVQSAALQGLLNAATLCCLLLLCCVGAACRLPLHQRQPLSWCAAAATAVPAHGQDAGGSYWCHR